VKRNFFKTYRFGIASLGLLCCLSCVPSSAASAYVWAAAIGSGNGSTWANACTDFKGACAPGSLTRGSTYYVASGNYCASGCDFTTPDSGSSVITIQGATAANHGSSTGWSNSMSVSRADGGAQAIFGAGSIGGAIENIEVDTDYWVFDGSVPAVESGGQLDGTTADYGFYLKTPTATQCGNGTENNLNSGVGGLTNITIMHVAAVNCGSSYNNTQTGFGFNGVTNLLVSNVYSSGAGSCFVTYQAPAPVVQYMFCHDAWSSSENHGEAFGIESTPSSNGIVRYSNIWNCGDGTGGIIALLGAVLNGWNIYGNVFYNCTGGNGVIGAGGDSQYVTNSNIYNNTIVASAFLLNQCDSGSGNCGSATGNVVENNVFYATTCTVSGGGGGTVTDDYNSWISCSAGSPPSEAHGQIATISSSALFANYATQNYNVMQGAGTGTNIINPGLALSSSLPSECTSGMNCYNIDIAGTANNPSDWMRGAYNPASGTVGTTLNPPTNLTALAR